MRESVVDRGGGGSDALAASRMMEVYKLVHPPATRPSTREKTSKGARDVAAAFRRVAKKKLGVGPRRGEESRKGAQVTPHSTNTQIEEKAIVIAPMMCGENLSESVPRATLLSRRRKVRECSAAILGERRTLRSRMWLDYSM